MNNDLNLKILESYVEIDKIHDDINNKMFNFVTKALELVELSEDDYQIEKTLKLNKISLKGYILDSDCCTKLNENNITDYSIDELKKYFLNYEDTYHEDCSKYYLAINLYKLIEEIEKAVDIKFKLEIDSLTIILPNIGTIKNVSKPEYEKLYLSFKNQLDNYFQNQKLDEKVYNICIQVVNDIFDFYMNGYPNISNEYINKMEE